MGKYKEENGKTRVGKFLKTLGSVADPILDIAADITGIEFLDKIGDVISGNIKLTPEQRAEALELIKLDYADLKNARESNVAIQESKVASFLAKNTGYIIDFVILGSTIGLGIMLFFQQIPEGNREVAFSLLGVFSTLSVKIVSFHRGTSKGSSDKMIIINEAMKKLMK